MAEQDTVEKVSEFTFPNSKTYAALRRVYDAMYDLRDFFNADCEGEFHSRVPRSWQGDLQVVQRELNALENKIRFVAKHQHRGNSNG